MLGNMTGWHFIILLAVVLLLFGAAKLPGLARSVGQSARIFKGEIQAMKTTDVPDREPAETPASRKIGGESSAPDPVVMQ